VCVCASYVCVHLGEFHLAERPQEVTVSRQEVVVLPEPMRVCMGGRGGGRRVSRSRR